jgi:hypothetical protein
MRLSVETSFHSFECVTVYEDVCLDDLVLVVDEFGDALILNGWACDIGVINDWELAPRPLNPGRKWLDAEAAMFDTYADTLPHLDLESFGWDRAIDRMAA